MKTTLMMMVLALAAQNSFALDLTINENEVAGKVREVSLQEVELSSGRATILADANGISVYTFDADTDDKSNCFDGCLIKWPTVRVNATEEIPAPFGRITGNDGEPQLTLKGQPLYYYHDDEKPGDVFGDYPAWHPVKVIK